VVLLARSYAEGEEVPLCPEDRGVRVLDLMQARGLRHRAVIWLGFHDGSFPRPARPDPFLGDEARAALAAAARKPLGAKLEASHEERLLLAMALAAAGEVVVLSFQRADEGGKRKARSTALREVARAFAGRPDARALVADCEANPFRPERISSHPGSRALEIAGSPRIGLLPPAEAAVAGAVLAVDGPSMALAFLSRLGLRSPGSRSALACLRSIDAFTARISIFDGRTGAGLDPERPLSPTAVERLARCPLAFFLRHVLGIREVDEETLPHRIEEQVLGTAVHATLASLYRELAEEGLMAEDRPTSAARAMARAGELLGPIWQRELEAAAGPSYRRLRGLFDLLGARWLASLTAFVEEDLKEIETEGAAAMEIEKVVEAQVEIAADLSLRIEGRLDRILSRPDAIRVDDYKTGKSFKKKAQAIAALRGLELQLPLYREAVAAERKGPIAGVLARLLGVGPDQEDRAADLELSDEERSGVLETVGAVVRLARGGLFPLFPSGTESSYCSWCGYRRTCRKDHEPTRGRLDADPELRDLRDLRQKSKKAPLLAAVRGARASAGDAGSAHDSSEASAEAGPSKGPRKSRRGGKP
jgi:RecB family exonuclease